MGDQSKIPWVQLFGNFKKSLAMLEKYIDKKFWGNWKNLGGSVTPSPIRLSGMMVDNAIMHRSYESNSPIYIYEFTNRIEILNPGGLYGDVNAQNFPNASDYRNVVIAEALKIMGYVNRFNYGVRRAIDELNKNGNGQPDFDLTLGTKFKVSISINTKW